MEVEVSPTFDKCKVAYWGIMTLCVKNFNLKSTRCKFVESSHNLKEIVCIVKEEVLHSVCNNWDQNKLGASLIIEGSLIDYLYHEFYLNFSIFAMFPYMSYISKQGSLLQYH